MNNIGKINVACDSGALFSCQCAGVAFYGSNAPESHFTELIKKSNYSVDTY
jgi:hypothetical protein